MVALWHILGSNCAYPLLQLRTMKSVQRVCYLNIAHNVFVCLQQATAKSMPQICSSDCVSVVTSMHGNTRMHKASTSFPQPTPLCTSSENPSTRYFVRGRSSVTRISPTTFIRQLSPSHAFYSRGSIICFQDFQRGRQ